MKISVITVCFNSQATIERTMKSVATQTYPNLEHVIVDGASKDATLEVVKRFPQRLGAVSSEKDRGIYDAMNKGVALATGDYLLFLNSDDWLADDRAIEKAVQKFDPAKRMQHGMMIYHHGSGFDTQMGGPVTEKDLRYELKNFHQPACFFHRDLFKEYGGFNLDYRISADYDLMRRFLRHEPSHFLEVVVTHMSDNGASATQHLRGVNECLAIARSFGESTLRTGVVGLWVRFWLFVRYRSPRLYWPVKALKDQLFRSPSNS